MLFGRIPVVLLGLVLLAGCEKKASEIQLGAATVRLLQPEVIKGRGSGGGGHGSYVSAKTSGHGFLCFGTGDLFIDNLHYGKVAASDDIRFGENILFVNGARRLPAPVPADWARILYRPAAGSTRVKFQPTGFTGGTTNTMGYERFTDGMSIAEIRGGRLYVQGFCYGPVSASDPIEVRDGVVYIKGAMRLPEQRK